jgi:hypothetical protein
MSLGVWMDRVENDPTVGAVRKLGELPESRTRHGAQVPWSFRNRKAYKGAVPPSAIRAAIREAPIEDVDLTDPKLFSIQHSVSRERVREYLDNPDLAKGRVNPKSKTPADVPIVIQYGGERFIHDGNHRLTAAYLEGRTTEPARLVDLDAMTRKETSDAA